MMKVTINRLGHRGDGVADGPIYVPRALPGETVEGTPEGAQLHDIRILSPSPDRVAPSCPHYRGCGGCQLQHGADAFVADWKLAVVRDALAAQGLSAVMRPIHTSPARSRRRATVAARRTKKGALAGFHGRASGTIVEIPGCEVIGDDLRAGLPVARSLAQAGGSRKNALAVTLTSSEGGLDVSATGGKPLDAALQVTLAQLAEAHDLARLTWDGDVIATRAAPAQRFGAAMVVPPPGAFLQATRESEATLLAAVQEATSGARRIADLFSGSGTFALPLAAGADVHAVESAAAMLDALAHGWRHATGLKRVTTEARDLFRNPLLPEELSRFDAVVLDPPRAGAQAQVRELAQAKVPKIAYVSCNHVTFARDVQTLAAAGYRLDWVQVVDQFRWSAHIELAACLRLDHMAAV